MFNKLKKLVDELCFIGGCLMDINEILALKGLLTKLLLIFLSPHVVMCVLFIMLSIKIINHYWLEPKKE